MYLNKFNVLMGFKNYIFIFVVFNFLFLQRICIKYINIKCYCKCILNIRVIFKNINYNNKLFVYLILYIKLVF